MSTKLVLVVLHGSSSDKLLHRLVDADYRVTEFASVGGFLRHKSYTLLIGIDSAQLEQVLNLIRETSPTPPGADQHTATVFVLEGEQFIAI